MANQFTEKFEYKDTGCNLHPFCLTCPFSVCKYEGVGSNHKAESKLEQIQYLKSKGYTSSQISQQLSLSKHSVVKVLGRING